jgi:hypothetical protein
LRVLRKESMRVELALTERARKEASLVLMALDLHEVRAGQAGFNEAHDVSLTRH